MILGLLRMGARQTKNAPLGYQTITYHSIRIGKFLFEVTDGSALSAKYQLETFDIFNITINNNDRKNEHQN